MTDADRRSVDLRDLVVAPRPPDRSLAGEVDFYDATGFATGEPVVVPGDRVARDAQHVLAGDVLLSRRADAPRRAWVIGESRGRPQYAASEWLVLRGEGMDPGYARHILVSSEFQRRCGIGSVRVRGRARAVVEVPALELVLPSIALQHRVAQVLDHADALRRKRASVLAGASDFERSLFVHSFGDEPDDRHPVVPLSTLLAQPPRRGIDVDLAARGTFPVLRPVDIRDGRVSFSDARYVAYSDAALARTALVDGDVLVACDAARGEVRCAVARPGPSVWFVHGRMWRLRTDASRLVPEYLHAWMRSAAGRRSLLQGWTEDRRAPVETRLGNIELPLPPIEAQRAFADAVSAADRLEGRLQASAAGLDALLGTLRDLAFRGELSLA